MRGGEKDLSKRNRFIPDQRQICAADEHDISSVLVNCFTLNMLNDDSYIQ